MGFLFRKLALLTFLVGALGLGAGTAYVQMLAADLPELTSLKDYSPPVVSNVYDRNGALLGRYFKERRTVIPFEHIPKHLVNAFLAAEDAAFFKHHGIDYLAVLKAGLNEIKYRFVGGKRRGGSTITQQTAKTFFLSPERTYTRKIKEMLLAKRIEENLSKEEILHLYLNQIYFGKGAYGVEQAALTYYGTSARDITLGQAAVLASIPKSPSRINPHANPERVRERRQYVLEQMLGHNMISQDDFESAQTEPIRHQVPSHPYLGSAPYFTEEVRRQLKKIEDLDKLTEGGYQIFTSLDAKLQLAANESLLSGLEALEQRRGWSGPVLRPDANERQRLSQLLEKDRKDRFGSPNESKQLIWDLTQLNRSQLRLPLAQAQRAIQTATMEPKMRLVLPVSEVSDKDRTVYLNLGSREGLMTYSGFKWAKTKTNRNADHPSHILRKGDLVYVQLVKAKGYRGFPEFRLLQVPKAQGALVAIDPHSREVLALVGGYNFEISKFNRATQAKRQPGSALKPFLYALALAQKKATPATTITDAPRVYVDPETGEKWQPSNSNQTFRGDISLRRCLARSINTCSIEILDRLVSMKDFLNFAEILGLHSEETPFPRNLSIALGTPEITLIQLVNAFAIFPAQGQYQPVSLIQKIKQPQGPSMELPTQPPVEALSPSVTFLMNNLLEEVVKNGTAQGAKQLGRPVAGKTGTTNESRSAWFVGYTPDLVTGVYVGMDDNTTLGKNEYGSRAALPIWRSFMKAATEGTENVAFPQPQEGVLKRIIHKESGLLADLSNTPASQGGAWNTGDQKPASVLSGLLNQVFEQLQPKSQALPDAGIHEEGYSIQNRNQAEEPYYTGHKALPENAYIEYFLEGTEPQKLHSQLPPPPLEMLEGSGFAP
ncbi:MAG: hypothetical protein CMH56_16590 [Myxococcales bacterium]|nr:hypothetical protein [Myxococcales bacterium]|tara:strand:- start:1775 stop:4438 length:2664 start_codon:yes stop_codon:yes gene_type:complete